MKLPFFGRDDSTAPPPRAHRPVRMYTTRFCGFCLRAKRLLDAKHVRYEEIAVDSDQARWREMREKSGRNTVPQIFIGDMHVGGCDDLYALEAAGELDPLLFEDLDPESTSGD